MKGQLLRGGMGVAVSAADGRTSAAAAWIGSAWTRLPLARHRSLMACETLFSRAGLPQRTGAGGAILAEPLDGVLGPTDQQIMLRVMAGYVAALVVFPNASAPAASRERLLTLIGVAVRSDVPVAFEAMAASRLVRRLAAEEAARRAAPPGPGLWPDVER